MPLPPRVKPPLVVAFVTSLPITPSTSAGKLIGVLVTPVTRPCASVVITGTAVAEPYVPAVPTLVRLKLMSLLVRVAVVPVPSMKLIVPPEAMVSLAPALARIVKLVVSVSVGVPQVKADRLQVRY